MLNQKDVSLGKASHSAAMGDARLRAPAVWFLTVQGAGVVAWWAALLLFPSARSPFLVPGAPDETLFAFLGADLLLYAGGSFVAAYGLSRRCPWAWPVLCIHAGAVVYAALVGLALPLLSGGAWLGAILMAPSLVLLPILVWRLRPGGWP
jgi:hypothetical protein